jgi:hypothetical protein
MLSDSLVPVEREGWKLSSSKNKSNGVGEKGFKPSIK